MNGVASVQYLLQAAQAAAAGPKAGKAEGALKQPDDDSLDPNQFYERRVKAVKDARGANIEPYPHKFETSIQVPQYVAKYSGLPTGEHSEEITESIAGGVQNVDAHSLSTELVHRWWIC